MRIKYQIITDRYIGPDDEEYLEGEDVYFEHEITAEDIVEYFKDMGEKVEEDTIQVLLDTCFLTEDDFIEEECFQDFMREKYEDDFHEWLSGD